MKKHKTAKEKQSKAAEKRTESAATPLASPPALHPCTLGLYTGKHTSLCWPIMTHFNSIFSFSLLPLAFYAIDFWLRRQGRRWRGCWRGARGWGWCSWSMLPRFAFGGLSRPVQSQLFSICFKATCKFRSLSACEIAWKSGKAGKCEAANSSCENCRLCTQRKRERTILQCNHKNYAESKIKQKIALPTDTCVNIPSLYYIVTTIWDNSVLHPAVP